MHVFQRRISIILVGFLSLLIFFFTQGSVVANSILPNQVT
jgi:hypothetical protein